MEMMVERIEAVRAKGERAEVGEEVSERNADSGNVTEQCYGNNWVWERIHAVIDCTKKKIWSHILVLQAFAWKMPKFHGWFFSLVQFYHHMPPILFLCQMGSVKMIIWQGDSWAYQRCEGKRTSHSCRKQVQYWSFISKGTSQLRPPWCHQLWSHVCSSILQKGSTNLSRNGLHYLKMRGLHRK